MRKKFIAGNWKMNKTSKEAVSFLHDISAAVKRSAAEIAIAAPFTLLPLLQKTAAEYGVILCAQNIHYEDAGAFTGEISGLMAKEFADMVIIGHSERRRLFHEYDKILNMKLQAALRNSLRAIFCLGETLEERTSGRMEDVLKKQLDEGLEGISKKDLRNIIIAYEPVWAIGTGKTATNSQAEEAHSYIRGLVKAKYGSSAAESIRIIYGGSVTPENAKGIMALPDVDGCLPGGASLDVKKFKKIIESAK
jgi:triosephosphate isomerase (TIM)